MNEEASCTEEMNSFLAKEGRERRRTPRRLGRSSEKNPNPNKTVISLKNLCLPNIHTHNTQRSRHRDAQRGGRGYA